MAALTQSSGTKASLLTLVAMLAFAGNSILCRLALRDQLIDPAAFTAIRIIAGAAMLLALISVSQGKPDLRGHGGWLSALMLFAYALAFSFAYVSLETGSGALILFGFVQATMLVSSLFAGERPRAGEWAGWVIASVGLIWLLLPGAETPSLSAAVLMAGAGIAWGIYSIRGKTELKPLAATTANFTYSVLFAGLILVYANLGAASNTGILLASLSGALTSGLGYVAWYAALRHLTTMQAALVQLSVPVLAATGGVVLLSEALSATLVMSSVLVLGGISLALRSKLAG